MAGAEAKIRIVAAITIFVKNEGQNIARAIQRGRVKAESNEGGAADDYMENNARMSWG
jgi:hypothetical protein